MLRNSAFAKVAPHKHVKKDEASKNEEIKNEESKQEQKIDEMRESENVPTPELTQKDFYPVKKLHFIYITLSL
jgi:hypothetical protein